MVHAADASRKLSGAPHRILVSDCSFGNHTGFR
jgi:hypothetical protein